MKKNLCIALVIAAVFVVTACSAPVPQETKPTSVQTQQPSVEPTPQPSVKTSAQVVVFNDADLEKRVREAMNKPSGDITIEEAKAVTLLNVSNKDFADMNSKNGGIKDISALKYFTGLKELGLAFNSINDLKPLSGLSNLESLDFSGTQVEDISPLKDLPEVNCLVFCWLHGDSGTPKGIENLDALANMQNLEKLDAKNAGIKDVSGLANLPKLWEVQLNDNLITDVGPLSKIKSLKDIFLKGNPVKDYSPFKDMFSKLENKDFTIK